MLTKEALWDPKEERVPEEREKWALRKRVNRVIHTRSCEIR